jgi:epoxide hydrolase-like predicted phosphatase
MPIRAVVFDIGGVLEVNPRTGWPTRWARRLGFPPDVFDERLDAIWAPGATGEATLEQIEVRTAEAFGLSEVALAELMEDAWGEYVGTLNQELTDWFAGLRPRYRTGILSNSFVGAREREQALYGFEDLCDVLVYSHEVGSMKPDARMYHAVCEQLGVDPAEAILLDDLPANVEGARAIGMRAITYVDTAQAITELTAQLNGATGSVRPG